MLLSEKQEELDTSVLKVSRVGAPHVFGLTEPDPRPQPVEHGEDPQPVRWEKSGSSVGGELEGPYGCPLHVRTRARLNTYSCLAFWGLEG